MDLSVDTLEILLFLAPGFLGFRLYMIDADWRETRHLDIIYGSLVFSAIGYGCYAVLAIGFNLNHLAWLITISFPSAVVAALVWKRYGHGSLHGLLHRLRLTNEDNLGDVWQKIFNDPRIYVTQITAYLKNGEAIECDETKAFDRPGLRANGIFPYYAHRDGEICFVPNRRKRSPDSDWEDVKDVEAAADWGLRMVYLNPDELQRLELRITPVKPDE